jgi:hypothetical protein
MLLEGCRISPSRTVTCVYCGAKNPVRTVSHGWTERVSAKIFGADSSTVQNWESNEIDCTLCKMKYVLISMTHYSWIKARLLPSKEALLTLKRIYRTSSMSVLFACNPVVTRVAKSRIHIIFEVNGIRAFMDCWDMNGVLFGATVQRMP